MKSILAQDGQAKSGQQSRVTWKDGEDQVPEKKGSPVLTTDSLTALAKEVSPKSLKLAMYLNIPTTKLINLKLDKKFCDAGEEGQALLLLQDWHKMKETAKEKDKVSDLERALRETGYQEIADVVIDKHKEAMPLTNDCFPAA